MFVLMRHVVCVPEWPVHLQVMGGWCEGPHVGWWGAGGRVGGLGMGREVEMRVDGGWEMGRDGATTVC